MSWLLALLLALIVPPAWGDDCYPLDCPQATDDEDDCYPACEKQTWIIAIGDTQVTAEQPASGFQNWNQELAGYIHDHRAQIAAVVYVGDLQGGGASDGSAGGVTQECITNGNDNQADQDAFTLSYFDPAMQLGVPLIFVKGNHDFYDCYIQDINQDYIDRISAMPTVEYATLDDKYGDNQAIVVNNFMGDEKLLIYSLSMGSNRDDYPNCGDPGEMDCDGEKWVDYAPDKDWVDDIRALYPDAYILMTSHTPAAGERDYFNSDPKYIGFMAGHYAGMDSAYLQSWGVDDVIYTNHNTQWYGSQGEAELTVLQYDPVRGRIRTSQIDTRERVTRRTSGYASINAPWMGVEPVTINPNLDGSTVGFTATDKSQPLPQYHPRGVTQGGYLEDDSCVYAVFMGDSSQRNMCDTAWEIDPTVVLKWDGWNGQNPQNSRQGLLLTRDTPVGTPEHLQAVGHLGEMHSGSSPETAFSQGFRMCFVDDNSSIGGAFSPGSYVRQNFLFCNWMKPLQSGVGWDSWQPSDPDVFFVTKWDDDPHGSVTHNVTARWVSSDPDYWTFHVGPTAQGTFLIEEWENDNPWLHWCWAWGKDAPAAGGTDGRVRLFINSEEKTLQGGIDDTTTLEDPNYCFYPIAGDYSGFPGHYQEVTMLDLSKTEMGAAGDLPKIVNYIRQCGFADNAHSVNREAKYGPGDILGPNGETTCRR